jgi:hypothetical protein
VTLAFTLLCLSTSLALFAQVIRRARFEEEIRRLERRRKQLQFRMGVAETRTPR